MVLVLLVLMVAHAVADALVIFVVAASHIHPYHIQIHSHSR